MCGFYAILNAFQCLFPEFDEEDAWELMVALCEAIAARFPAVIWKGAGVEDTVKLFTAAKDYAARTRHLRGGIVVTRPFARRKVERIGEFWEGVDAWFAEGRRLERGRVVFLGIGYPDNHWTIVTGKTARALTFFDSWELERLSLRAFTLSLAAAKAGKGLRKLDTRQTFFIERVPRAAAA
jgi:hypothetical protein